MMRAVGLTLSLCSCVGASWLGAGPAAGASRAPHIIASASSDAAAAKPVADGMVDGMRRAALVEGLKREYESFFQPMETELYNPAVSFTDPLINFEGIEPYRNNVDMLAGKTLMGKLCFTDCGLTMHSVRDLPDGGLETRWTLQFRFKLLPWKPLAQFTGVSRYTLDGNKRVVAQQDYWDSINLQTGGSYALAPKKD